MRCPQCGTQNEPDSRFCGGCGARLAGTLAPTQKISPDAQFTPGPIPQPTTLQRQPPPPQSASQPVARAQGGETRAPQPAQRQPSAPQSVPRQPSAERPSVPPIGQRPPRTLSSPNGVQHARSFNDASLVRASRPWGIIIVVLAIDLALAAAGGWLLSEGLADPPASAQAGSAAKTSRTSNPSEAVGTVVNSTPVNVKALVAPTPVPVAAQPEPIPIAADPQPVVVAERTPVPDPVATPVKVANTKGKSKARTRKPLDGPVDPYAVEAPPPPGPPPPPLHESQP
ncbi:MAG: zinc-ribbon domain-containing protein [Kofleriaceae bacterium]